MEPPANDAVAGLERGLRSRPSPVPSRNPPGSAGWARLVSAVGQLGIVWGRGTAVWSRVVVATVGVRTAPALGRTIVTAVANRGAGAIVVAAESGALVTIGVGRVQLRRLFLQTLGLGSLPFGLGDAGLSVLLSLSSAKLRFGTFAASGRLPLLRGRLGRLGLSGEPLRFLAVITGLYPLALIRLAPESREKHNQRNDDQQNHHHDYDDNDWIHSNPLS